MFIQVLAQSHFFHCLHRCQGVQLNWICFLSLYRNEYYPAFKYELCLLESDNSKWTFSPWLTVCLQPISPEELQMLLLKCPITFPKNTSHSFAFLHFTQKPPGSFKMPFSLFYFWKAFILWKLHKMYFDHIIPPQLFPDPPHLSIYPISCSLSLKKPKPKPLKFTTPGYEACPGKGLVDQMALYWGKLTSPHSSKWRPIALS